MEQLLHQYYATTHVSQYVPVPGYPPDNDETSALITRTLDFLSLYHPPNPYFKLDDWQNTWTEWAKVAEERLNGFKAKHVPELKWLVNKDREPSWRQVLGDDHSKRSMSMLGYICSSLVPELNFMGRAPSPKPKGQEFCFAFY